MQDQIINLITRAKLHISAPLTGGATKVAIDKAVEIDIIAWSNQYANVVAVVAAVFGMLLGLASFLYRVWYDKQKLKNESKQ